MNKFLYMKTRNTLKKPRNITKFQSKDYHIIYMLALGLLHFILGNSRLFEKMSGFNLFSLLNKKKMFVFRIFQI